MAGKITAVIGAQYGSEGKGAVVHALANKYNVHVRVGSPNAGHTFYWNDEKHVMQSIPCGWSNPNALIVIGRGALINMALLSREVEHIEKYYPTFRDRLIIDAKAGVLDECFRAEEGGVCGEMHRRIGSTGEGVGPARMARLSRDPLKFRLFESVAQEYGFGGCMYNDTPEIIYHQYQMGSNVMLEGSQGSGLSLLHSYWPYCTSIDTNAAAVASEVGIAPRSLTNVLLVARTYPIRVAGNSGPMNNEITWEELSRRIGKDVSERTTVTKKVRRVGEWDSDLFHRSCILNGPTDVALMFTDYVDPSLYGATDPSAVAESKALRNFMVRNSLINTRGFCGPCVTMFGTGPATVVNQLEHRAGGVM